jgi:hypothetical protein
MNRLLFDGFDNFGLQIEVQEEAFVMLFRVKVLLK